MKTKAVQGYAQSSIAARDTVAHLPENVCFLAGAAVGLVAGSLLGTKDLAARAIPPCCKKAFAAGMGKVRGNSCSISFTPVDPTTAPSPA